MTTPTELREKVARAIFEELDVLGISVTPEEETRLGKAALAVVRAELAEPSAAMLSAGIGREPGFYTKSPTADAMITWRQMFAASPLAEPGA